MLQRLLTVAVIVTGCLLAVPAQAQGGDFFWSTQPLNSGAPNGDLVADYTVGDTGTLYIYWTTNGPSASEMDTGGGLDITTSAAGVIQFLTAETHEFPIMEGPTQTGVRWGDAFGPAGSVTSDAIDDLNAFSVVTGDGIINANTGPLSFDQGYDVAADAFLFATITFDALAPGSVDLNTVVGAIGVVHNASSVNPTIGAATINVMPEEPPAPETIPTMTEWALMLLGALVLVTGTIVLRRGALA
ncbi:MAG: hypothetical protein AAF533_23555 [Acidobacteriota bacterium]